jgi:hypothetical protein
MRRIGIWVLWIVLGIVGLTMCLWTVSRLRGPTAEQVEALALMQQSPLPTEGNAFPALWLLAYDVPESRLQAIADADAEFFAATPMYRLEDHKVWAKLSTAHADYADQTPSADDFERFCKTRQENCLDKVRADPAAYDALIERNRALLDRVAGLSRYSHYRYTATNSTDMMLPPFQLAGYGLTRVAWQFARGDVDEALAGACDGVRTWRRLGAHSDSLLARMIGIAYASDGYARLLAQMLAELPASHELPASCDSAFSPPAVADLSICEAMKGEFSLADHAVRSQLLGELARSPWIHRAIGSLVFDVDQTSAMTAVINARHCSDDTNAQLQLDQPMATPESSLNLWRLECVANFAGCVLTDVARPAYADYQWRAQDYGARLELMAALLWLREHADPDEPLQAQLTRRWEATRRGDRGIRFVEDGSMVELEEFSRRPDREWRLPLLPSR